jgi:catechol 2,3-dioxygenase-like lactoylglutathione lyase family enzyme
MAGKKKEKKKARKAAKKAMKAAQKEARRTAELAKAQAARKAAKPAKAKAPASEPKARVLKPRRQPETLRLYSAGPSLTVGDIHRSLAFYRDVLGFTPKDRWEENGALKGLELVAGSVSFWLGQDNWEKGRDRAKGVGFRMYCGTTQDIDRLAERVRSLGVALAEEPKDQSWGRDFAVRDPDGFLISISTGL